MVKLSVSVQNLKTFKGLDKSLFDRFYFGYPYCLEKSGSFLTEPGHLKEAISEVKKLDKEAFLVTPGLMQNSYFDAVTKAITNAVSWGLDGLEIHDVGLFAVASKWPDLKVLAGYFTNIYNTEVALEYIKIGASTVLAHPELTFEEIKEISEEVRGEVGIIVYGSLPLGIVYDCYLKTVDPDGKCRQQCSKPYYFKSQILNVKSKSDFSIKNVGTANVMANEFCLLEHMERLKEVNADYWRLETSLYDAEKINAIGKAFRDCINGAKPDDYIDNLKELAPKGLCDGWFLGQPGHSYSPLPTGERARVRGGAK